MPCLSTVDRLLTECSSEEWNNKVSKWKNVPLLYTETIFLLVVLHISNCNFSSVNFIIAKMAATVLNLKCISKQDYLFGALNAIILFSSVNAL